MNKSKIFITGINSGLGKNLYQCFSSKYDVYGLTKKSNNIDNIYSVDFNNIPKLKKKLQVFSSIKKIDIIILNAGILGKIKKTKDISLNEIQKSLNINFISNKIIIDYFLNKKIKIGLVIGISSGAALNIKEGWLNYTVSKSSFKFLLDSYSKDYKKIKFININPGPMDTEMQTKIRKINKREFKSLKIFHQLYKDKKLNSTEQVAKYIFKNIINFKDLDNGSFIDIRDKL